jgi:hypothetical protein
VGAVLELAGQQRRSPEQPEQQRDRHGGQQPVDDEAVAAEHLAGLAAVTRRRTAGDEVVIRPGYRDAGDQQHRGQHDESGSGSVCLTAVQPPDQGVH